MVRVYSQPGHFGAASLGGLFGDNQADGRALDFDDYKRRDDQKFKGLEFGGYGGLKSSASDGYLDRAVAEDDWSASSLQKQIDSLSDALSRLQGYSNPDYSGGSLSKSYPTSAQAQEQSRKTWSAPNKDPFGPRPELINLADPMGRRQQASQNTGYVPSFGSGPPLRGRRGGGNAAPPGLDRDIYLQQLQEQMQEQQRRRTEDKDGRDWWEKSEPMYNQPLPPKPQPNRYKMESNGGDARKQYEMELREQMEFKKRLEDTKRAKEKEEEDKLERRTLEQQERMKREFDDEMTRKRMKEEAKIRRQEELMRRQMELQREMLEQKKPSSEPRLAEKRGGNGGGRESAFSAIRPVERHVASPPVPTLRRPLQENGGGVEPPTGRRSRTPEQRSRPSSQNQEVIDQLSEMRRNLEKRRDELMLLKEEKYQGAWQGLEE